MSTCRGLGVGVADREDRMRLVFSGRGGLGATSLEPDPAGEIGVAPLDSMVSGRVDLLKIDVEGMEMSVLAGSRELIRRWRPLIFIEIANRNTLALMDWLKDANYGVARIFTDKGHANYLLAPRLPADALSSLPARRASSAFTSRGGCWTTAIPSSVMTA